MAALHSGLEHALDEDVAYGFRNRRHGRALAVEVCVPRPHPPPSSASTVSTTDFANSSIADCPTAASMTPPATCE